MKKKITVSFFSFFFLALLHSQVISETFEDVNALMNNGWATKNLSNPRGLGVWYQDMGNFVSHSGSPLSTIIADFTTIPEDKSGTISCWLFTPELFFGANDSISFWANAYNGTYYANRIEVRLSTSGASTNVGNDENSVGDFSTLLYTINSDLSQFGFPNEWLQHKIKLPVNSLIGLSGRIAFRYYVTDGGPMGYNGSTVGIDDFKYYTEQAVSLNEKDAFSVQIFPNPVSANSALQITLPENGEHEIAILAFNGIKFFKKISAQSNELIALENLPQGVYLIQIKNIHTSASVTKKIIIQ